MTHFKPYISVFKSLLFTLLVTSCTTIIDWNKQIDTLITGQSYVIPIGETTITLQDFINQLDSIHYVEPGDNYIFLNFKDTIDWKFRDVFDFQNFISINRDYLIPASIIPSNTTISTPDFTEMVDLNFNSQVSGQRIDYTEINTAKVEIIVEPIDLNISPANIRVTTLFNTTELAFTTGGDISEGAGSTIVFNPTVFNTPEYIDLNPFTLYTPNNLAALSTIVRVEVTAGNTPIIVLPTSKINVKYRLFDVKTKAFYGIIQPTVNNEDQGKTIDMTGYIMQLPLYGVFKIAEPIIKFDVYNNSGVKINLLLDSIKAYKAGDATFEPVYANFDGSKSISKPIDRVPTFGGAPTKTTLLLDHTLSNGDISHFFDRFPLPDVLMYKFRLTNARTATDPIDFATPDANLTAFVDINVPLKFNAGSNFEIHGTLKNIDFNSLIDTKIVNQMTLILKVTNNLPLKGKISLTFLDENYSPINDLRVLSDSTINAPQIDDSGLVIAGQTAVSNLKINILSSQLSNLRLVKNVIYTIKVENEENKKMTLQKENYIKLNLGKFSQGE